MKMSKQPAKSTHDIWREVFERNKAYTMITEAKYVETLQIIHEWARQQKRVGDVVECGAWRGGMTAGIADVLGPVGVYHLFDSFQGLPPAQVIDGVRATAWQQNTGGPKYYNNCRAEMAEAEAAMAGTPVEWRIHAGWFHETFPRVAASDLCLLRLDGDWYDSTLLSLQTFFPRLQEGGLLLIDDYYIWEGCCRAVHDYLSSIKSTSRIRSSRHVCYLFKTEQLS